MHASRLIELATKLSIQAEQIIPATPDEFVHSEAYWNLSKEKLDHWNRTLAIFKGDLTDRSTQHNSWSAISCVVEEILCSEFFVRIVSAAFVIKDQVGESALNGPVARSIFLFHLEARMRALELIELGLTQKILEAKNLNELRRRLESWCDLLLAFFPTPLAREFAFDTNRYHEFKRDIEEDDDYSRRNVVRLLQISIYEHGRKLHNRPVANPTLNRRIAALFDFLDSDPWTSSTPITINTVNDLTLEAERWISDYLMVK